MSVRDSYPAGVPCWVTNLQPDVSAARGFYEGLFGWEMEGGPAELGPYALGRKDGREVAAIGSMPEGAAAPAWVMEVCVDDLGDTAARVRRAGGEVLQEVVDFGEVGRLGVYTDAVGAVFCGWEPGARRGAQLVNAPGAWSMNALQTDDTERADRFYRAVFGWESEPFGPVTLWRRPGYVGGEEHQPVPRDVVAVMLPSSGEAASSWGTDFWIDDVDRGVADVRRLGGTVLAGPYDAPPSFRQAVVADPGGAPFTISELVGG